MEVQITILPIAGFCGEKQELKLYLEEGSISELAALLEERFGVNLRSIESLLFLRNGRGMDVSEDVVFADGDQLALLPQITGG